VAKSRRKSSGCKAGTFKVKKMGKGWSAHRSPKQPIKYRSNKKADQANIEAAQAAEAAAQGSGSGN